MRIKSTSWSDSLNITIFSLGRMPLVLATFNCSGENIIFISEILAAKRKQFNFIDSSILIHVLPLDFSRGYINCLIDEVVYLVENHKI